MTFQPNESTAKFLNTYTLFQGDIIQQIQLQHRLDLVKAFDIQEGMHVLEIGCGQGDTTAALADAVGETGHIVAIDIASPDYGAPLTLGQATNIIKSSTLGKRVEFHFEMDFNQFESNTSFDVAVLSHCSWYFKQPEDLLKYFIKLRKITNRICLAEWDLDFSSMSQRSHFFAASILGLYSNFVNNEGNIQNLFDKAQLIELLEKAEFDIEKQLTVDATYLQDGKWETDYANSIRSEFDGVSPLLKTLITSYYDLMNASDGKEESLNSFVLCGR